MSQNNVVTASGPKSESVPQKTWIMGAEAFQGRMEHHDGIRALWETRWKAPCSKSLYPFHDGKPEDFAPIFDHLIANNINDSTSAAYTEAFFPIAEALTAKADKLMKEEQAEKKKEASDLYLRACTVYRIARFPYITALPTVNDEVKWKAWQAQKDIYIRAARTWESPVEEIEVPHIHRRKADPALGTPGEGETIPVYVRLPKAARETAPTKPVPVIILVTGLDGYRPDNTTRLDEFNARGWASVTLEIPGTADCPADPVDPTSPERLWDSLFAWMAAFRGVFDMRRVVVWGLSSGGYYAVRIAHTHASQLAGSVGQGAGTHFLFDPAWIVQSDNHEYPFEFTPAMAVKHGFDSVERYIAEAQGKFSLLDNGILDKPATRLLLINGIQDGLMPIEDSLLLFEHGTPKEARLFPGAMHMGYPKANLAVYPWMESVMASVKD